MGDKITVNVDQYVPNKWNALIFSSQKEKILQQTSEQIRESAKSYNIYTVFRGKTICLSPIEPKTENPAVRVDKRMNSGLCGDFDFATNIISTNASILKDGRLACESVSHETTHSIQCDIANSKNVYQIGSLESEYATIAKMSSSVNNKLNAFDICVEGRLYMSGKRDFARSINSKSSSLYALSPMERHASLTAINVASQLPKLDLDELSRLKLDHLSYSEMYVAQAVINFKREYCCEYLSLQQVYQTVDNAQTFIAFGYGITNDLEANVAYDMMAFIEYENSLLPTHDAQKVLLDRMSSENKIRALNALGYSIIDGRHELIGGHIISNDMPIYKISFIDQLIELPRNEQIANPLIIANFAFEKEVDVFPHLHCPEAFEEWLFSESSLKQLPIEVQEGLGAVLGEKYSLENRRAAVAVRLEQQSSQVINEDVGYVFDRDDRFI